MTFSTCFVVASRETVKLPITFVPSGPGHYPCRIILRSHNDIRVYQIECTVNPEGSSVEIEFTSPTHESVTQDVPVVRKLSRSDFTCKSDDDTRLTKPVDMI